ncbi:hypothetical protein BDR07DRAFT_1445710 [Suillus spraguei]|nr:hypothetical protein BDR07DRAFT_1445710 [Suillus spraguei]
MSLSMYVDLALRLSSVSAEGQCSNPNPSSNLEVPRNLKEALVTLAPEKYSRHQPTGMRYSRICLT